MPRVYLIFRNQLFGDAVRAVLRTHPGIELVGATTEPDRLSRDVVTLMPDVVLLEDVSDNPAMSQVHTLLSSPIPDRLIMLRLDEDGMHVWSQTWQQTVQAEDLVQAIITAGGVPATNRKNHG